MVDHVRTLILNESAAKAGGATVGWSVPSDYKAVALPSDLAAFYSAMFSGTEDNIELKVLRVEELVPFVADPEFEFAMSIFDSRTAVQPRQSPSTVFSFYGTMSGRQMPEVNECIAVANPVFSYPSGLASSFSTYLDGLKQKFLASKETTKRFSACLLAYLIRVEAMRINADGGRGR